MSASLPRRLAHSPPPVEGRTRSELLGGAGQAQEPQQAPLPSLHLSTPPQTGRGRGGRGGRGGPRSAVQHGEARMRKALGCFFYSPAGARQRGVLAGPRSGHHRQAIGGHQRPPGHGPGHGSRRQRVWKRADWAGWGSSATRGARRGPRCESGLGWAILGRDGRRALGVLGCLPACCQAGRGPSSSAAGRLARRIAQLAHRDVPVQRGTAGLVPRARPARPALMTSLLGPRLDPEHRLGGAERTKRCLMCTMHAPKGVAGWGGTL